MFTKTLFTSLAFGAVGLAGIGYFWMKSKKRSPREKEIMEIEDLTSEGSVNISGGTWGYYRKRSYSTSARSVLDHIKAKKNTRQSLHDIVNLIPTLAIDKYLATSTSDRPKSSFKVSAGTWGYNLKYNGLTSTKSILAHNKTIEKNTSHLLCDIADLVPVLKTDIFFEINPGFTTRNEIPKAKITEFMDINYCSDITMLISLKDIRNVLFALKTNPLVRSFTAFHSAQQQGNFNVFALRFPSRDVLCTIYCSMLTQHLKAVFGDLTGRFKINFRDNTLSVFVPKTVKFHNTCKRGKITNEPSKRIKGRSDKVLNDINKTPDTVLNHTSELTVVSVPKPDIPMKIKKLGNPVAIINQLIPCINYHHRVVSNPPPVIRVEAKIRGQTFEAEASTKKAAVMEICIDALQKFYNYEHSSAKIIK